MVAGSVVAMAIGVGCGGPRLSPQLDWITDGTRPVHERVAAIEAFTPEMEGVPWNEVRESLKDIVFRINDPQPMRIAAMRTLAMDDANRANTVRVLMRTLPLEARARNWGMIEAVGEEAAARGWNELAPAFVASWAREVRGVDDEERPERVALMALTGSRDLTETVFDAAVMERQDGATARAQRDAVYALLCRLDPEGVRTAALLVSMDDRGSVDPVFIALTEAARVLSELPRTPEQLGWFAALAESNASELDGWLQIAERFGASTGSAMSLRHLPALAYTDERAPHRLTMDGPGLRRTLEERLAGRRHWFRTKGSMAGARRELLRDWRDALSVSDLLVLHAAIDAVDDAGGYAALTRALEIDRVDTSTEYGGLVRFENAGSAFRWIVYPPRGTERFGDERFVASAEMIAAQPTALFHFHMQVQRAENEDFAGASTEDVAYAARWGRACLVLTSVSEGVLNADYYQPNGARVDLGEIVLPGR